MFPLAAQSQQLVLQQAEKVSRRLRAALAAAHQLRFEHSPLLGGVHSEQEAPSIGLQLGQDGIKPRRIQRAGEHGRGDLGPGHQPGIRVVAAEQLRQVRLGGGGEKIGKALQVDGSGLSPQKGNRQI
jgi:hypothetical protein